VGAFCFAADEAIAECGVRIEEWKEDVGFS
jgi:hypothetical protein